LNETSPLINQVPHVQKASNQKYTIIVAMGSNSFYIIAPKDQITEKDNKTLPGNLIELG
jgi:hypothetical protein